MEAKSIRNAQVREQDPGFITSARLMPIVESEAKDPYDETNKRSISGILRRGVDPELAPSVPKGEVEGLLRMTSRGNIPGMSDIRARDLR